MSKEPPFWWHVFSLSGFSALPFFLPLVGVTKRRPQFFYSSVLAYQACHYTMLSHFIRPVLIVFYEIFISPNSFLRLFVRVQHSYWFVCLECWSSASLGTLALFEMTAQCTPSSCGFSIPATSLCNFFSRICVYFKMLPCLWV